jgi:YidC/Oxa1 family membrane protein insertase
MDRNSIIGLILIAAIMIGYSIYTSPSKEELEAIKRQQDSITAVNQAAREAAEKEIAQNTKIQEQETVSLDSLTASIGDSLNTDSLNNLLLQNKYGAFANAAKGEVKYYTIENDKIIAKISNKGARIVSVILKDYKTYKGEPVELFQEDSSSFSINFYAGNKAISTKDLFFEAVGNSIKVSGEDSASITMRLKASDDKFLDFVYTLKGNEFMLGYSIQAKGLQDIIANNASDFNLNCTLRAPRHEKSLENERNASTIYFKYVEDEVDYLSETSDEKKSLDARVKWIAFKQQFFSTILIAEDAFDKYNADIEIKTDKSSENYVKDFSTNLSIPYKHNGFEKFDMHFYFGPNHYQTLKSYNLDLHQIVPLGWGIFGWVNKFLVIPVFNWLNNFNLNFGIIILILTLLIKALLFPLTYKSYLSMAKMRLLKPDLDEINKKFEKEDPLKKQQAIMSLYKRAGVSPFGGCLPMLLQMPILIAMFRFFPASIELRGKSFLWADDLSTYDSILDLPFNIPFYGDHVSLFTLLMTASTILYTRMNSQFSTSPEMAQMKWMMYLMPIIFLGVFNNYSAGLSYYYFLANMITFGQQFLMKKFVDENKLHAQIEENKKKPVIEKKSSFQKRLEEAAKRRGKI